MLWMMESNDEVVKRVAFAFGILEDEMAALIAQLQSTFSPPAEIDVERARKELKKALKDLVTK